MQFRQAARIRVTVKAGTRVVPRGDASVRVSYARSGVEGKFSPVERILPVYSHSDNAVHDIDGVAPGEDVVIDASIKGALQQRTTIRLAAGETKHLTIDLAAPDSESISVTPVAERTEQQLGPAAALTIKYDIPGGPEEAPIFVEREGVPDGEIGSEGDRVRKWTPLKNGASFDLQKLSPGDYQVARIRSAEIIVAKDPKRRRTIQETRLIDRHRFSLKAGEHKTIDFSRRDGQRVTGLVERAGDVKPARMILYVCSPNAKGIDDLDSLDTTIFDAQQCNDGDFTTEQLQPGEYSLIAVGYDAWPREAFIKSGFPRPNYIGRLKLTVPRSRLAEKLQVPLYRIHFPAGS